MLLLAVILFLMCPLFAQTDSSMKYVTDEVIVTATRINQKLIEVPFPALVINPGEMRYDRKTAINDVLSNVPGVFMQPRYGNHDVRISIRGFGSRSNTGIRGVRILMDGIPESEPDGQTRIEAVDLNAVNNIELVRGNASSVYTNAPGGVINFRNSFFFPGSFISQYNEFGGYGLRRNGLQFGIKGGNYNLITTYTYHNYDGYREHSSDYWHVLNTVLQTYPSARSNLEILGYLVNGIIRLPGSLTKEEFVSNPYQAASRETKYDFRRVTKKGRVGLRFSKVLNTENEFEVLGYGTIKYFERAQRDFRIMNRHGLGGSAKYVRKFIFLESLNTLSAGGDFFYQTGPVENYVNFLGTKTDTLRELTDESISNSGFYISLNSDISDKLSILLTTRYDYIVFDIKNNLNSQQNSKRTFTGLTPKIALNYKLNNYLAVYGSWGLGFDSPAGNELDDYPRPNNPGYRTGLLNTNLNAQRSMNSEIGMKGLLLRNSAGFLKDLAVDFALFNSEIRDEIVPFEVDGDVFYRNSARTSRKGIELGITAAFRNNIEWKSSYTLNHFRYSEYSALSYFSDNGMLSTSIRDYSGNIVPSVPGQLLNTELLYKLNLTSGTDLFITANYLHVPEMYTSDVNDEKTDSYSLVNSTAGIDLTLNRFSILLSASVLNLLDETYVSFININSTTRRYYEAGQPQSFHMTLKANYRL